MKDSPKVRKRKINVGGDAFVAEALIKFGGGVSPDGSTVVMIMNGRPFEMTSLLFDRVVASMVTMQEEVVARRRPSGETIH